MILRILFICCCQVLFAQKIILTDSSYNVLLHGNIWVLKDSSNNLRIQDIRSPEISRLFVLHQEDPYLTDANATFWVKIKILNRSFVKQDRLLELWDFRIGKAEYYNGINQNPILVGNDFPFNQRTLKHKNIVLSFSPAPLSETELYLRIQSQSPFWVNGAIKTNEAFMEKALHEYAFLVIFYGIIAGLFCYSVLLMISTQNFSIGYYAIYIFSVCLVLTSKDNLGFQFVWNQYPRLNPWLLPLGETMMIVFLTLYTRSFLQVKGLSDRILIGLVIARVLLFFSLIVSKSDLLYAQWYDLLPLTACLMIGVMSYRKGNGYARYYSIALLFILSSVTLTTLMNFELLPLNVWILYSLNFGVVADLLLLSIAITEKVRQIMSDKTRAQEELITQITEKEKLKDKVNRELEAKVQERTTELALKTEQLEVSNQKLQELSLQLQEMNRVLDGQNWQLNKELVEKKRSIILDEALRFEDFFEVYPDDLACLRFLEEMKWGESFTCRKCGHKHYNETDRKFSRKCTRCDTVESATSSTLFHGIKFPLPKAFYIVYVTAIADKKITVKKLSEDLQLRYNTCLDFRNKIIERQEAVLKKIGKDKIESWEMLILD